MKLSLLSERKRQTRSNGWPILPVSCLAVFITQEVISDLFTFCQLCRNELPVSSLSHLTSSLVASFCFFCVPTYISGVHFSMYVTFFIPSIEAVTFRLRGRCMLGVFFVAGTHPSRTWLSGSFESLRWNGCVHRLDLGLCSPPKEILGNGVRSRVNSKRKIPSICPPWDNRNGWLGVKH